MDMMLWFRHDGGCRLSGCIATAMLGFHPSGDGRAIRDRDARSATRYLEANVECRRVRLVGGSSTFVFAKCSSTPFRDGYDLFAWRPGHRLRWVHVPPLPDGFGEGVFTHGLRVSPGAKHVLLLVAGTQGDFDIGMGTLLCVDMKSGYYVTVDGSTPNFRWMDASRVVYEVLDPTGEKSRQVNWKLKG